MAQSKTEISNIALALLGADRIDDFDDDSIEAVTAKDTYDHIRDQTLRDHPWNFAIKRATISIDGTAPDWEFANRYALPADHIRLLEVNGQNPETNRWRIEDAFIVTDLGSPINIRYIFRQELVGRYDASFVMALAASLAWHWAEPLTKTAALKGQTLDEFRVSLSGARTSDGQESTVTLFDSSEWIDVRY